MPHIIAWCGFLGAWLLLPPVWWLLSRRRDGIYRHMVGEAMEDEDLLAFLTVKDVLNAWLYVAVGASLLAVGETWDLHEIYEWPEWTFWFGVVGMLVLCVSLTVGHTRRRHHRPAVDG